MGEKPDQIERHIYEKRNELGENIHELQQKVKTAVDWRAQVEQRPLAMIGIAFGGGLLLSMLFSGGRKSYRSSRRWRRERQRSEYGGSTRTQDWEDKTNSTWDNIRSAVLAVATTRLGSVLEELLPGFQDQYKKRQYQGRSSGSRHNGPESAWRRTASGETDYMPQT